MGNAIADIQILVTANAAQGTAELQKFSANTTVAMNAAASAASNLNVATSVATAGQVTLTGAGKTTAASLHALGRVAKVVGFQFMPNMTSSVIMGAGAIKDLSKAAAAASISIGAMSVALAGLAIAGATANEWWKFASSRVDEENAATKTAQANERLAESLLKVAKARRDAGVINDEQFLGIQSGVIQARAQPTNEAANNALRALMNRLVNEQGPMQKKEFEALRAADETESAHSQLVTRRLLLDVRNKETAATLEQATIAREIADIELRRGFTAKALKEGAIDESEMRKLELEDLGRIVELESRRKQIREDAIRSSPFITEANKFNLVGGEGADPNSLPQQMAAGWVALQNQIGTVSQNIASTFTNVVGGSISNISAGISGIIKGTTTWAQVLSNIGSSILDTVIDGIVKMFVAWIAGDRAKTVAAQANGAAEASAKAPGALMTSISSFGVAAAVGVAALLAAMAISGAFAEGGRPPSGRPALVGERGPELFIPDTAGTIISAPQTAQMMRGGGGSAIGGGAGSRIDQTLVAFFDKDELHDYMRDHIEAQIVQVGKRHFVRL